MNQKTAKQYILIRNLFSCTFLLFVFLASCENDEKKRVVDYSITNSNDDLKQADENDTVLIKGLLKKWTPWSGGKGGGSQYFNYEISFDDSTKLPVVNSMILIPDLLTNILN